MKILWVTNIPLPEASMLLNENSTPFGGWLISAAERLVQEENIELQIAFPRGKFNGEKMFKGKQISYFIFPEVKSSKLSMINDNPNLEKIINYEKPDVVHIFGTEFAHTLAMVNVCIKTKTKVVISIQGIISVIAKHYTTGLPRKVQNRYTFRDFIKQDNILQQQKKIAIRGNYEIEALRKVSHIIGRTTWDRACTSFINDKAQYYYCNETLRSIFYQRQWNVNECEKYSIFISQGSYPIKGLHFMIKAMSLVIKRHPNARLYIGGSDITKCNTLKEKLKISSYGKYIKKLINKYEIQNNIIFTGILDEENMCKRFLDSHIFVCTSTIENSPNSLGEAMILGVPSIASDVGGISDLLKHKEEGFVYQADAPYMLAHYICEIFKNEEIALKFSKNAKIRALKLYDQEKNNKRLLDIYISINEKGNPVK